MISILAAELTLGNKDFFFHLWVFEKVKPVAWSLPIHVAGFCWIVIWNSILRNRHFLLVLLVSIIFFTTGELINYSYLNWFMYTGGPLGRIGALFVILLLYLFLCACVIFGLRKYGTGKTN